MAGLETAAATALGSTATELIKDMSQDPKVVGKDEFVSRFQAFALMHPEWDLNDVRVLRALRTTIIDGWSRGQEKVLEDIVPLMVKNINVKNIDLNEKDWLTKIAAEEEKAKRVYELWLQSNLAKQKTDLEANSAGMITYEKGAAGFGALGAFVVAIIESFTQGSLDPIKAFVADSRSSKAAEIHARATTDVENKYARQDPKMDGAVTAAQAVKAGEGNNPLKAMTGETDTPSTPKENAGIKFGGGTADLKENATDLTKGKTPDVKHNPAPQQPTPIVFGYTAPALEYNK